VLGRLKKMAGDGVAALERIVTQPEPLPAAILASRVVLVGASVSVHWHVEVRYPCVSVRAHYSFDKTPVVDSVLARLPVPDAVIVKQCAAYFPIPLETKKQMVLSWLDRLAAASVVPVVATVVPVTVAHDQQNPGRMDGILEYNEWIRCIAGEREMPLLDLESALRRSSEDPHLDEKWATRDGLHLRRAAYRERLDQILGPVLTRALM
jgi:hypothetical protein